MEEDVRSYLRTIAEAALDTTTHSPICAWQLLETAPKDGSWLLLCSTCGDAPDESVGVGFWDDLSPAGEEGVWNHNLDFEPTHWMPLPDLPKAIEIPSAS